MACRTWLVEDDGIPVATVTYRPDGNHDLWTDDEREEPAVYMSRLVINRKYAGLGVGADLTELGRRTRIARVRGEGAQDRCLDRQLSSA